MLGNFFVVLQGIKSGDQGSFHRDQGIYPAFVVFGIRVGGKIRSFRQIYETCRKGERAPLDARRVAVRPGELAGWGPS